MSIKDRVNESIALLCARFSKTFFHYEVQAQADQDRRPPRHLAAFGESISRRLLGLTLKRYTKNSGYLKSLQAGAERIDLNGNPQGVVTEEEALHATSHRHHHQRRAIKKQKRWRRRRRSPEPKPEPRRDGWTLREAAAKRRQRQGAQHEQVQ